MKVVRKAIPILLAIAMAAVITFGGVTPASAQPAEVWVDDDWADSSPGDVVDGRTFGTDAFAKIQDGIDAVASPGIVHVAAGTYYENINFINKSINVMSESGPEVTIINGDQKGSVVTFSSSEEWDSVLNGFTITNGSGTVWGWGYGGGIYASGEHGYVRGFITNNIITNNTARQNGGGIYLHTVRLPLVIEGNYIQGNNATGDAGGGIFCFADSSPSIKRNIIVENTAFRSGGGIGCYSGSSPIVENNLVINNSATKYCGGGIDANSASPEIICNTIVSNSAPTGGGVNLIGSSSEISNCIIWNNGDDLRLAVWSGLVSFSNIEDGDFKDINGNISEDPLFVNPAISDYHLQAGSPCIDAGTNEGAPAEDIEGNSRPIDGDGDGTATTDMGAYEYVPPPPEVWVDDDWAGSNPGDKVDGHVFGTDAFAKIQDGIDAVAGSTVHVAAGDYESITLKDGVQVLGAGADVTTIDGSGTGSVVAGADNSTISGFTITNSGIPGHAGITCGYCSPVIDNNKITDNNGRGIFCYYSNATITNNIISNNGDWGIWQNYSSPTINNNLIFGNSRGIECANSSNSTIINNTITENAVGIGCDIGSSPIITNNIITCCGLWGIIAEGGSFPTISYNDVWDSGTDYVGSSPGIGDISANPMFVYPAGGDYHLQAGSPCIDAGTNEGAPAEDIEGNPRPVDGDGDGIATTDMGAYEYIPPPPPPPSEVWVVADPVSLAADGLATSVITATAKDQYGQLVPDDTSVTFATDHGTLESDTVTKTTSGGMATANLTSELSAETVIATVTATANGASGAAAVFFIPEGCPGVEECQTGIVCGCGTCKNTVQGMGDIDIDATGDHVVTTAKYEDNPAGVPTFEATGDYYDVHLDDDTSVNSLTMNFCPATPDTVIYYWSGTNWTAASDQGYSDGCVTVTVTESTYPSLSDLTGLPFATATRYGPPVAVGREVYLSNKIAVLAPWASLIVGVAVAAVLTRRRRRVRS